jgi:hypothetical protein
MKRPFILLGPSMKPTMHGITIVWCTKPENLAVGDIVLYSRKNKLGGLCHRIIDKDEQGNYLIKGDNAPEIDSVPLKSIFYKVDSYRNLF